MSKSRPQRSASKRKAEDGALAEPLANKSISSDHTKASKKARVSADPPSEEALFKIRHAAEFDGESARGEGGSWVQVKQEPKDDDAITASPRRVTRSSVRAATITPCRTKIPSAANTPEKAIATTIPGDVTDQDSIFVAILSQGLWSRKMTESAIENLSQRARQRAANGQLFDVAYVRSIIDRLDQTGIESTRRSHVVDLLQTTLRSSLGHWSSCINSVGIKSQLPQILPGSQTATIQGVEENATTTPSQSRLLYVDVSPATHENPFNRQDSQSDRSESTSIRDSGQDDTGSESEYVEHKGPSHTKSRTVQIPTEDPTPSAATDHDKTATNVRLYGTRLPKAAFDVLVRCIIFAWAAAHHPGDTPANIREFSRPRWRKVPWEQKCAWQKLHEERGDPAVDELRRGLQLLTSQNLLRIFVPSDRLPAALLRCQQYSSKPCDPMLLESQLAQQDHSDKSSHHDVPDRRCLKTETSSDAERLALSEPLSSTVWKNFPRMIQATSDTPSEQGCLVPSTARRADHCTCIFILDSPDVRSGSNVTEDEVSAACEKAGLPGFSHVMRQTQNVFVAFFADRNDANRARKKKVHLKLAAATDTTTPSAGLKVKSESHWLHVNTTFMCDTRRLHVNHLTVARRVFQALNGPLASSFQLLRQEVKSKLGAVKRIRYLLRLSKTVTPIFVERFYIPLDTTNDAGYAFGIFKPWCRHWDCPCCHQKCQTGLVSTCPDAVELGVFGES